MVWRGLVVLLILASGCGGDDEGDPPGVDTAPDVDTELPIDPDPVACPDNRLERMFPAPGRADVFYRTRVEFLLQRTSGTETIRVEAGGQPVAGATEVQGALVVWTPSEPLRPSTPHRVLLEWECGPSEVFWATGPVGQPVDPAALVGKVYGVDPALGRFLEPAGMANHLRGQLDRGLLFGVDGAGANLGLTLALASHIGVQDRCAPTVELARIPFGENPWFEVTLPALALGMAGGELVLREATVSGAFAPAGVAVDGVTIRGAFDARELAELLEVADGCQLAAAMGATCGPCPDGSGDHCLPFHVDSLSGPPFAGLALDVRTPGEVAAEPDCG